MDDHAARHDPCAPMNKGRPDVSVVIPYFDDQARLTLLLRSLQQQEGDVRFDVVVADDGSPEPPVIPTDLGYDCTVVTQPDEGFRAAAARNLGAEAASGEFLVFLDGDTFPTSRYLSSITGQLRESDEGHGVVVVGRRRHADLRAADEAVVLAFLRGDCAPDCITLLEEPTWLLDGYARTDDLRSAGDEDFRLIISAVLAVDRRVWTATGGFDPDFVGYGGEDWDFGWRAWLSGAEFSYQADAVAWHDGPDAGGRGADPVTKNTESLRLAQKIALPSTRGTGLILRQPEIVIRYIGATVGTAADAAVVACVAGLLDGSDAAVWFEGCSTDPTSPAPLPPLLCDDPRVHQGDVPSQILDRARFQVWVERPVRLTAPLHRFCDLGDWAIPGKIRGRRTRSIRRNDLKPQGFPAGPVEEFVAHAISDDVSLERWWGDW
ncbi:glycosyltransferase family 2 protein [Nakamurella sp. GG22]